MQFWFIISLIFAVLIAFFAVLNSDVVTIRLIFKEVELSQSVIILGSAAIGAIVATFIGIFNRLRSSLKIRELNNQIKELESNISMLKSASSGTSESKNKEINSTNSDNSDENLQQQEVVSN